MGTSGESKNLARWNAKYPKALTMPSMDQAAIFSNVISCICKVLVTAINARQLKPADDGLSSASMENERERRPLPFGQSSGWNAGLGVGGAHQQS